MVIDENNKTPHFNADAYFYSFTATVPRGDLILTILQDKLIILDYEAQCIMKSS